MYRANDVALLIASFFHRTPMYDWSGREPSTALIAKLSVSLTLHSMSSGPLLPCHRTPPPHRTPNIVGTWNTLLGCLFGCFRPPVQQFRPSQLHPEHTVAISAHVATRQLCITSAPQGPLHPDQQFVSPISPLSESENELSSLGMYCISGMFPSLLCGDIGL